MSASVTRARDESAHVRLGAATGDWAPPPQSDASTSRIRMFIVLEIRPLEHYMRPARGLRCWPSVDRTNATRHSTRSAVPRTVVSSAAGRAHRDFPPSRRHSDFSVYRQLQPRAPLLARPWSPRLSMLLHLITDALPTAALQNESTRG